MTYKQRLFWDIKDIKTATHMSQNWQRPETTRKKNGSRECTTRAVSSQLLGRFSAAGSRSIHVSRLMFDHPMRRSTDYDLFLDYLQRYAGEAESAETCNGLLCETAFSVGYFVSTCLCCTGFVIRVPATYQRLQGYQRLISRTH